MKMTVENFSYSKVEKYISDFSHVDKVRFGVYCAELVIDIYEKHNSSKAPRRAIEAAKKWIESPTWGNKQACNSRAANAANAASAPRVADAASASAAWAAWAAANAASAANAAWATSYAVDAAWSADSAARAAGESMKENIVNWLNEFNSKNIETPEEKEALESISGKITIDIERYKELCGFEREIKIRDLMKETAFSRDVCKIIVDDEAIKKVPTDVLTKAMASISITKFICTLTRRYINRFVSRLFINSRK
jgi:hypothetical protein